ncbi:MAG: alpha/beta hydrolase [Nitrospirae bacterium]|nr:alpha/beta hydrolase [Nitrospirota bacterium]MBF0535611.1 alpha/beta hydrolase [Nitrospirota bacterium]MBF0617494.1 alpha/beta hydrolase [Nitrospirota bacterium]
MLVKRMLSLSLIFSIFILTVAVSNACGESAQITGVLLLHGKGGSPPTDDPVEVIGKRKGSHTEDSLNKLMSDMKYAGFIVIAPNMPYSGNREYCKSYEDTLTEVDSYVAQLRQKGATRIFIAGHSLGANVAIAYAAKASVDGVVAMAPGHVPEKPDFQSKLGDSLKRARQMAESGNGGTKDTFTDSNQGLTSTITTTADIYLSWFLPDGPAVMPSNAASIKPGTAFMWVVGTQDKMYKRGPSYAYNKVPSNTCNKYLVVNADHMNTPRVASEDIIKWIQDAAKCVSSAP